MIGAWRFWGIGTANAWAAVSGVAFAEARTGFAACSDAASARFAAPPGLRAKDAIALPPREIDRWATRAVELDDAADSARVPNGAYSHPSENHLDAPVGSAVSTRSSAMGGTAARLPARAMSSMATASGLESFDAKRAFRGFETRPRDLSASAAIARHGFAARDRKTIAPAGLDAACGGSALAQVGGASVVKRIMLAEAGRRVCGDASVAPWASRAPSKRPDAVTPHAGPGARMLGALSLETPAAPSACCDAGATCRRAHGAAIEGLRHAHGAGGGGARRLAGLALVVDAFLTDSSFNSLFALVFRLAYEDAHEAGTRPARRRRPASMHGVPRRFLLTGCGSHRISASSACLCFAARRPRGAMARPMLPACAAYSTDTLAWAKRSRDGRHRRRFERNTRSGSTVTHGDGGGDTGGRPRFL